MPEASRLPPPQHIHLKVLLPFQVFIDQTDVLRIVAHTRGGSLGLLPQRLDCVAALAPGILIYESASQGEVCVAVDEGVLVKHGAEVRVSVRRAFVGKAVGTDLTQLRAAVKREFVAQSEEAQDLHQVMAKLEAGFMRRMATLHHD